MAVTRKAPVFSGAAARRAASLVAVLVSLAASAADLSSPQHLPEAMTQHIRHIEDHLLPPVMLNDEPVHTATLLAKMRELGVPGVSIAYLHHGRIAWTDAVGVRRLGGAPVDSDTVFQSASISKPVTAMAVMALTQSGALDLDRDVRGYLRTWKLPDDSALATGQVTIRRLLSHTAGASVHGFEGYSAGEAVPSLIQVLNGEKPANSPPVHIVEVPGSEWSYSGGGYEILQQVLLDITKKPFAPLLDDLVLRPAGMLRSSFQQPTAASLREDAATPYDTEGKPIPGGAHIYPEQAAAGLWTTPSDLARFAMNLQRSLAGRSDALLRPKTARAMLTPTGKGAWALGFRVGGGNEHPWFLHGGSNAGFRALLAAFDDGDGVAIMTNGDAGLEITSAILRTVAAEYDWPQFQPPHHHVIPLSTADLDRFVGRFRAGPEDSIKVTRKGDRLYVQIDDDEAMEITPEAPARFFSRTRDMLVIFELDAHGRPTEVKIDGLLATYRGILEH